MHLDEGEFSEGFDSMPVLYRDDNGIASLHLLLLPIEHEDAFALYECPGFASMVMNLVADVLGHSDVNTTRRHYAALEEDRRRNARNKVQLREKP